MLKGSYLQKQNIERFNNWVSQGYLANKNHHIFTIRKFTATKLNMMVIHHKVAWPFDHVVLWDQATN